MTLPHPFAMFCHRQGIEINVSPKLVDRDRLDPWKKTAFAYQVQLHRAERTLTTDFWCGSGHVELVRGKQAPKPPTAADVLASLLSDASTAADLSFEDWAADLGMDSDSRKALDTYQACKDTAVRLRTFLGADYDAFVEASRGY